MKRLNSSNSSIEQIQGYSIVTTYKPLQVGEIFKYQGKKLEVINREYLYGGDVTRAYCLERFSTAFIIAGVIYSAFQLLLTGGDYNDSIE